MLTEENIPYDSIFNNDFFPPIRLMVSFFHAGRACGLTLFGTRRPLLSASSLLCGRQASATVGMGPKKFPWMCILYQTNENKLLGVLTITIMIKDNVTKIGWDYFVRFPPRKNPLKNQKTVSQKQQRING